MHLYIFLIKSSFFSLSVFPKSYTARANEYRLSADYWTAGYYQEYFRQETRGMYTQSHLKTNSLHCFKWLGHCVFCSDCFPVYLVTWSTCLLSVQSCVQTDVDKTLTLCPWTALKWKCFWNLEYFKCASCYHYCYRKPFASMLIGANAAFNS